MRQNPLFNLIQTNKGRGFFNVVKDAAVPVIYIYDVIVDSDFWGGIAPLTVAKELAALNSQDVHIRFNSPGGDAFAGRAMETIIRDYPGNVTTFVDGYAASAATYPALAGKEMIMSPGAFFMIHESSTIVWGNKSDMQKMAALLDKIDASFIKTYAAKTGNSEEQVKAWLEAETWFNAEEAVQFGFASQISGDNPASAAKNTLDWDLTAWQNAPKPTNFKPKTPENSLNNEPEFDITAHFEALRRELDCI